MELHHRIVLAFAVGAAVLPVLGLRMHARKNLCHAGSLGCCGLAILSYVVYAWIMARQENWFALSWLAHDLKIALPLLLISTLITNVFCIIPQQLRNQTSSKQVSPLLCPIYPLLRGKAGATLAGCWKLPGNFSLTP